MNTLEVALPERSYPIYIGGDLLGQAEILQRHIAGNEVLVVTNDRVAPLYLQRVMDNLTDYRCESVILPDGEQYKSLEILNQIFDQLLTYHYSRQVTIIALGGGVIGDMSGFAASCYQRGVPFIQVPTTLLSQVDSSVGGKTSVNHKLGKNMIGAFYQPQCVIADTETLNTLDDRQLASGLAEVIKYGLINDIDFFSWLEEHIDDLIARKPQALAEAIRRSCQNKADIVANDELEHGIRALLNLGHTFGHAIETGLGYGHCLHGEAIAIGTLMAADLSCRMGWLDNADVERIKQLLLRAGLPVKSPEAMTTDKFMSLMAVDKKVQDGRIRLVLLSEIGKAVISDDYSPEKLKETLDSFTTK